MLYKKNKQSGFLCCHPVCTMLLGALAGAGAAAIIFAWRDRLSRMARAVGHCACGCANACGEMVVELREDCTCGCDESDAGGDGGCGCADGDCGFDNGGASDTQEEDIGGS